LLYSSSVYSPVEILLGVILSAVRREESLGCSEIRIFIIGILRGACPEPLDFARDLLLRRRAQDDMPKRGYRSELSPLLKEGAIHLSGRETSRKYLGTFSRRHAGRLAPPGRGRSPHVDGARGPNGVRDGIYYPCGITIVKYDQLMASARD
jgi:hypothetical protein